MSYPNLSAKANDELDELYSFIRAHKTGAPEEDLPALGQALYAWVGNRDAQAQAGQVLDPPLGRVKPVPKVAKMTSRVDPLTAWIQKQKRQELTATIPALPHRCRICRATVTEREHRRLQKLDISQIDCKTHEFLDEE